MEPQGQPIMQNSQPIAEPAKKCKHLPAIIVLAILAAGGLGFGGYELWQNIQKDEEIKNLQAQIDEDGTKEDEGQEELNNNQNCSNLPSEKHVSISGFFDDKTTTLLNKIYSEYDFDVKFLKKGQDGISEIMEIGVALQQNKKTGETGGGYLAFYYRAKHGDDWTFVVAGNGPEPCSNYDENILEAFGDLLGCVK